MIEHDAAVAVDYYFQVRTVGANPQAQEATNRLALDYLGTHEIDAAIVDYQLRDGSCEPVLRFLQSRGIPFVVVSRHTFQMRRSIRAAQVILMKPVLPGDVWRALSDALR